MKEFRGVRDTAAFLDLRKKVDDWYAHRTSRRLRGLEGTGGRPELRPSARERLDATFRILQRPECDKATASDFILSFVECMLERPEMGGDILSRFADVVRRYNAGLYQFDSIRTVASAKRRSVGAEALAAQLAALPRPEGLLDPKIDPNDGYERHVSSGYAFWDDAGLHLSYPGDDWRKSA
ncbi:hypothetical protein [Silicimonas sp. MF1-12-2]|uniref:hypothetical protein n=1 Tax=Silicimonas sp. MF1-12-2 TaxID=3384793 RepID=UPI0039B5A85E